VILRRRDDRHQLIAPFRGLADRLGDHAIGFGIELLHELDELGVVREDVISADLVAEELLWSGDPWCRRLGRRARDTQQDGDDDEAELLLHPPSITKLPRVLRFT
jgi:hypothetical protein